MQTFNITYSDGQFWLDKEDTDGMPYQEIPNWQAIDKQANGARWGLKYKEQRQRKWRISSAITLSIQSLLTLASMHLKNEEQVICLTPDIEVHFIKD